MTITVPAVGAKATAAWADAVAALLNSFLAVQSGTGTHTLHTGDTNATVAITYPTAYLAVPIVVPFSNDNENFLFGATDVTTTGFNLHIWSASGSALGADHIVQYGWLALGDGSIVGVPSTIGGVPAGGTAGQVLAKVSGTDYDDTWVDGFTMDPVQIGAGATATGAHSVAVGTSAASSDDDAVAIGDDATASAVSSTALGGAAQATALGATALGTDTIASAAAATAVGNNANATAVSTVAIGDTAVAAGLNSISIGLNTEADGDGAIAIGARSTGFGATAAGLNAVAIGGLAHAGGAHSVAVGEIASAAVDYSVAVGYHALANGLGTYKTAVGAGTSVAAAGGVAIGADSSGTAAASTGTDDFTLGTASHKYHFPGVQLGFYGATPVVKAGTPTTLANVITILQNLGLCS